MSAKLTRKEAFRIMRTGWVLEFCQGSRLGGWWWVREKPNSPNVQHVHASAAYSIVKNPQVEAVRTSKFDRHYRIKPCPTP